jgi:eukaryotic translation initiation factor 2C
MTGKETSKMIEFAVQKRTPELNLRSIAKEGLVTSGLSDANVALTSFGLKVNRSMIPVPGRILKPPTVYYKSGNTKEGIEWEFDSSWNVIGTFLKPGTVLNRWKTIIVNDAIRANDEALRQMGRHMKDALDKTGMRATFPTFGRVSNRVELDTMF